MEPLNPTRLVNKRKRISSSSGIFTRSKSQIYVHPNRSGRVHHDSVSKPVVPQSQTRIFEAIPVKHLRTRRVFSNGPAHYDSPIELKSEEEKVENVQLQGCNLTNKMVANVRPMKFFIAPGSFRYRRLLPFLEDIKPDQTTISKIKLVDSKDQCSQTNVELESHNLNTSSKTLNDNSVAEYSTGIDCNGSTEISKDEKPTDGEPLKFDVHSITGISNNYAYPEFLLKNENNGDVEQRKGPHSSNKMVSSMRPRKVFKVPGSFSYRRLLPFLEDTERDQTAPSKFEIANEQSSSNVNNFNFESCDQDASKMTFDEQYVTEYCTGSSNNEKTVNAESHKLGFQPIKEQDISGAVNNDMDPVSALMNDESFKNELDGPIRVDDFMEQRVQSISGQDLQLRVNKQADAAFGDSILNNGNSINDLNCLTGVDDLMEEYIQSLSEPDLSHVVNKDSNTIFGDNILNHGSLKSDWDGLTGVNDLQEVNTQTTPPDSEIFATQKMEGCLQNIEGKGCVPKSILPFHTPDGIISTNGVCNENTSSLSPNQSNVTPSKMVMVLNPCSRQRVFKPSGSFSYRRLLPYLTSVATTFTSDSTIADPETPKMERGEKDPKLSDSLKQGTTMNHLNPESSPKMQGTRENRHNHAVHTPIPKNYSDQVLSSATSSSVNDHLNALDMQNEAPLQTVNAESNFLPKLNSEISFGKVNSVNAEVICSNANQNTLLADSTMEVSSNKRYETDHDSMHVDNEQVGGTIVTKERPSKELLNHRNHVNGSDRGILKRNPRGCRGLCDCLHCASFRLHAEKAFWFSRNQLQDAEEVACYLVKELSSLRHMLDCSTAEATDPTVIHFNQLRVKEVCRKALEAEKRAKERFNEMNEDLNNHCRTKSLSRPRVTFCSKKSN